VYKPKGCSSSDVVEDVKRILENAMGKVRKVRGKKSGIKVGHGGTLDPMAEGVLVLGLGDGTKLLTNYLAGTKGYRTVALLGKATDTLDITGAVLEERDCAHITHAQLLSVLPKFRGDILQMPPMYSALRKDGKRLYELARSGIEVERPARAVAVQKLEMIGDHALPYFGLEIECGGGTYVRSLIDDICKEAGGVGCMTELVRTRQAMFGLEHCLRKDDWTAEKLAQHTLMCNKLANVQL
jgi:tRNA pseudouridine55 synthase